MGLETATYIDALVTSSRFWSKVQKTDACWLWQGAVRRRDEGYGAFWLNGRHRPAHRVALELSGVDVPEGAVIAHKCDQPRCVRPDHLFVTSQAGNIADKVSKNRQAKGGHNGNAKLSAADIRSLRALHAGGESSRVIASMYGVSRKTIWEIVTQRTWREVA